jgi:hypothetical protein
MDAFGSVREVAEVAYIQLLLHELVDRASALGWQICRKALQESASLLCVCRAYVRLTIPTVADARNTPSDRPAQNECR